MCNSYWIQSCCPLHLPFWFGKEKKLHFTLFLDGNFDKIRLFKFDQIYIYFRQNFTKTTINNNFSLKFWYYQIYWKISSRNFFIFEKLKLTQVVTKVVIFDVKICFNCLKYCSVQIIAKRGFVTKCSMKLNTKNFILKRI